ncbi:MAG: class I SAM-dependent methyltransferase, partial [Candidatus Aenigmarchaeota archaeon]|nr:class I SAM-dependent methyltransferase [Candidatus Aenigmarchaeota archaeon]
TLDQRANTQDARLDVLSAQVTIEQNECQTLAQQWFPQFNQLKGRAEGGNEIYNIAQRVQAINSQCIGRVGAEVRPMILRVLTARSIDEDALDILEIGTLFGASLATIYDCCFGFFHHIHITAVDPLTGYYQRTADPVTMVPVTAPVFHRNMARLDIPASDYTLICQKSQDTNAIVEASKRTYNLLIIDGDHTDFGVSHDYRSYRPMVRDGGYIIFDDWGDTKWGVDSFIQRELSSQTDIHFVGADHRTAIYRTRYKTGEQ